MKQNQDELAKTLRDGAADETPEFSDALHTRVMSAVRREKVRAPATLSAGRLLFVPLGAAMAVLLSVVAWMKSPPNPPAPGPLVELPAIPPLDQVIRETTGPVRQKLQDARFAYLDRDGKRLARFLLHSVPGVPLQSQSKHDPANSL